MKLRSSLPLIVEIPSPAGDPEGEPSLGELVLRAIGIKTIAPPVLAHSRQCPERNWTHLMTTVEGNIETLSRAILGEAQAEIEEVKRPLAI